MKVKLFSILAEEIGPTTEVDLKSEFYPSDVKQAIEDAYPKYKEVLDQSLVAIDEEYADDKQFSLNDVAEIAIIPPVSGG
ncbi:MoaD/ThiS family protein [Companilactobacillus nodensis]|uniref:MoaD/ThiS family protein n=1 Tax=Companilactobacillus nodensis TaxID=460870 RepID=UPI000468DDCC|nr:MoaD/ThiS family protein [Companilactobacillus nodensis]